MPQSEAAPSSPSAASTTPLPEPISSTLAPRTLAALACSTWIRAAVYSLGRKAASASSDEVSDTSLGFDTSITPKTHFPGTVPTNALRTNGNLSYAVTGRLTNVDATGSSGNSASISR